MYFLFGIIDKEKRAIEFRDCYPILDKKAESVFRQKCYSWYTGTSASYNDKTLNVLKSHLKRLDHVKIETLQYSVFYFIALASDDTDLTSINASIFQSPGGRKFLNFINPFVRYVAKHHMKVVNICNR